jgi:hypothetical protein
MARFNVKLTRTASSTLDVGTLNCATASPRRFNIYDLTVGSDASPADNAFLWEINARTALQTGGTTVVPQAIDISDVTAASTKADMTATTNGAGSGIVWGCPLNQRATFRWVAAPGSEIVSPALACSGFGIGTPTSSAVAVEAYIYVNEY